MNHDISECIIRKDTVTFDKVLPLFSDAFGPKAADALRDIWEWKYFKPPFQFADGPRMFIIERRGIIIGFQGMISCRIKIGPEIKPMIWAVDFAVHPRYQRQGLGIQLLKAVMKEQPDTIQMGTPLPNAYQLGKKLGCRDLTELISHKRITAPAPFFRRNNPLAAIGASCLFALANIVSGMSAILSRNKDLSILEADAFDSRFDQFWNEVQDDYEAIVVRDAAYLNWRFMQRPGNRYSVLAAMRGNKIVGYMVTRLSMSDDISKGDIVDFLTRKNDTAAFTFLLHHAVKRLTVRKAAIISCTITPFQRPQKKVLRGNGFFVGKRISPLTFGPQGLGSDFLPKVKDWYLTLSDSDFEMI